MDEIFTNFLYDDVIKRKFFWRNWPFVRKIHRSRVNSPHEGQWRGALVFSLICVWINAKVNNREAGDLRHHRAHNDVIVINAHQLNKYQWASYQIRKIVGCACAGNAGNVFSRRRIQRKPRVSDPGMHHGTCVKHVPWCMSGLLNYGGGENVPGIPGACARAIWRIWQEAHGNTVSSMNRTPLSDQLFIAVVMFTDIQSHWVL